MPIYLYTCDICGRNYQEGRSAEEPQWHTTCECGGKFMLKD